MRMLGLVVIALEVMIGGLSVAAAEPPEIVIEAAKLDPPVLRAATDQRVTFVNRSSRLVHVEFQDDLGQHHVFQVPGSIWAVFYRPGRHSYVVHFVAGGHDLRGSVDVEAGTEADAPPECSITVMGACLER